MQTIETEENKLIDVPEITKSVSITKAKLDRCVMIAIASMPNLGTSNTSMALKNFCGHFLGFKDFIIMTDDTNPETGNVLPKATVKFPDGEILAAEIGTCLGPQQIEAPKQARTKACYAALKYLNSYKTPGTEAAVKNEVYALIQKYVMKYNNYVVVDDI